MAASGRKNTTLGFATLQRRVVFFLPGVPGDVLSIGNVISKMRTVCCFTETSSLEGSAPSVHIENRYSSDAMTGVACFRNCSRGKLNTSMFSLFRSISHRPSKTTPSAIRTRAARTFP